jgi:hypothetical protein
MYMQQRKERRQDWSSLLITAYRKNWTLAIVSRHTQFVIRLPTLMCCYLLTCLFNKHALTPRFTEKTRHSAAVITINMLVSNPCPLESLCEPAAKPLFTLIYSLNLQRLNFHNCFLLQRRNILYCPSGFIYKSILKQKNEFCSQCVGVRNVPVVWQNSKRKDSRPPIP